LAQVRHTEAAVQVAQGERQGEHTGVDRVRFEPLFMYSPGAQLARQVAVARSRTGVLLFWLHSEQAEAESRQAAQGGVQGEQLREPLGAKEPEGQAEEQVFW
jgi:hypothetical protein